MNNIHWGQWKVLEFADGRESLLAVFMDVSDVLFKAQFIVQSESEVVETLLSDAGGVVGVLVSCTVHSGG